MARAVDRHAEAGAGTRDARQRGCGINAGAAPRGPRPEGAGERVLGPDEVALGVDGQAEHRGRAGDGRDQAGMGNRRERLLPRLCAPGGILRAVEAAIRKARHTAGGRGAGHRRQDPGPDERHVPGTRARLGRVRRIRVHGRHGGWARDMGTWLAEPDGRGRGQHGRDQAGPSRSARPGCPQGDRLRFSTPWLEPRACGRLARARGLLPAGPCPAEPPPLAAQPW